MTLPDLSPLANHAAAVLTPYLPYLFTGLVLTGKKVFERTGEILTDAGFERAKKLWGKLQPQVVKQPEVQSALVKLAEKPDDPRIESLLSWHLEDVLKALPPQELTAIQNILTENTNATVTAKGSRSVAIGGSVSGSTIITGDSNTVGK